MTTSNEYIKGHWTVITDGILNGYIDKSEVDQFEARTPHQGGHKGGIAPLVGTFQSFKEAEDALLPTNCKVNKEIWCEHIFGFKNHEWIGCNHATGADADLPHWIPESWLGCPICLKPKPTPCPL